MHPLGQPYRLVQWPTIAGTLHVHVHALNMTTPANRHSVLSVIMRVRHYGHAQADGTVAEGFDGVGEIIPPGLFDNGRPGRGEMALGWEELSGKLALVARLLAVLRQTCDDK